MRQITDLATLRISIKNENISLNNFEKRKKNKQTNVKGKE